MIVFGNSQNKTDQTAKPYQVCTRCVMDTSDSGIMFDENGVCNHCHDYDQALLMYVHSGETGRCELEKIISGIKREGVGKQYDCVIGVSGGVDSTYVAYKVKQFGLRPLAVHLDNGWDSELAVKNIELTLKRLNIDLYTHVLDWEEFKDLQLAFLKASTPDSEVPSDHAIFALVRQTAEKIGVRTIISGMNIRTESHLPAAWSQGHSDWTYISSIQRQFGSTSLKTYPHYSFLTFLRYRLSQRWVDILNYLDYVKSDAMSIIEHEIGWKYYGGKHYESIYTRFYQGYILPQKFGFDKRRTHLSSLICSGEITREAALEKLQEPVYPFAMQEQDREYVIKKLGLTDNQFDAIMNLPKKTYWDYPSSGWVYRSKIYKTIRDGYLALNHTSGV